MTRLVHCRTRNILLASAACGLATALPALTAKAEPHSEPKILMQRTSAWNGVAYSAYPKGQPQLTTLRITIPAHFALPWHSHASPNAAYVLSGTLTVEERATGRKATFHAGEVVAETVGIVHRGVTGNAPVVLIVTYAGTPGVPLSSPAK